MRDRADNCVVVCSIENFDPMGVHTGDSITVAPAQTLSDVEYQLMRDAAFACIRRVGVETGGSNIQFAVRPTTGEMVVIEMNPRVSRSSALASKATGFPIAKIAARLAVGYTLDEIPNDITRMTPASFEPTIDYVVTKVPRWAFEKLPGTLGSARNADAVGGRGDGHRPHVRRVAAEGLPLARDRPLRTERRSRRDHLRRVRRSTSSSRSRRFPRPSGRSWSRRRCVAARRWSAWRSQPGSIRGSSIRSSASPTSARVSSPSGWTRWTAVRGGGPSASASPTLSSRTSSAPTRQRSAADGSRRGSRSPSRPSTRVVPSSQRTRPTTTAPTRTRTRCDRRPSRGSSSSGRGRTASVRASSSTTAACTRRSCCATRATRP